MQPADAHERFTRLLLEHEPQILCSVMMFVPNRADAREILQETAVALWKHFAEYDPARPFANWACGFARMEVRRFLRKAARRQLLSEQAAVALMSESDSLPADLAERERHLADCMNRLPDNLRQLLDGYYSQEQSVETLADTQGRTVEAVYKLLQRTRHGLLECIQRKMTPA